MGGGLKSDNEDESIFKWHCGVNVSLHIKTYARLNNLIVLLYNIVYFDMWIVVSVFLKIDCFFSFEEQSLISLFLKHSSLIIALVVLCVREWRYRILTNWTLTWFWWVHHVSPSPGDQHAFPVHWSSSHKAIKKIACMFQIVWLSFLNNFYMRIIVLYLKERNLYLYLAVMHILVKSNNKGIYNVIKASNQSWTPENDGLHKNIKQHNIEH